MNTRVLASILTLALLLAPITAPLVKPAAAASFTLEVSAQQINYNVILLEIKGVPSDTPPAVLLTLYDADGNVIPDTDVNPYMAIAGYIGGGIWHVYIALNKTFEAGVFTWKYANTSSTKIGLTDGTEYQADDLGNITFYTEVGLESPAPLSRTTPELAVNGKLIANITQLTGNANYTSGNLTQAWPIVNAINTYIPDGGSVKITVDAGDLGTASVTITVGPAGIKAVITDYLNMAPEKTVTVTLEATTIAADPTAVNSLTTSSTIPPIVLETNGTTTTATIFNSADAAAAVKAALLEANSTTDVTIEAEILNNTATDGWMALNISATGLTTNLAAYVKLTFKATHSSGNTLEKTAYVVLTGSMPKKVVFNWTGIDLETGFVELNITSVDVTIIPANIEVNINGYTAGGEYTVNNVTQYWNVTDYAFFVSVAEETAGSGTFTASIYMPGRNDMPSYDAIKESYGVNDAPVVVTLTDVNGVSSDITGFIKLQTGILTVTSSVKPGETLSISVEDIDAPAVSVEITLYNTSDKPVETGTLDLEQTAEGQFQGSLKILLGSPKVDDGVIYVNSSIASIEVKYVDKYGAGGSEVTRLASSSVAFWPVDISTPAETYADARLDVTLTSQNFNLDSNARETLYVEPKAGTNYAEVKYDGVIVGRIYVDVYDSENLDWRTVSQIAPYINKLFVVRSFFESATDSGQYTIFIYIRNLPDLNDGDTIRITYEDLLNGVNITKDVPVKVIEGKLTFLYEGEEVDLTELPIAMASGGDVVKAFTIRIDDADANKNISGYDTVTLYFDFIKQDGSSYGEQVVLLNETNVDTGVFEGIFNITYFANGTVVFEIQGTTTKMVKLDRSDLPFGKLVIKYYDDSLGTNTTKEIKIRTPDTASLTITPVVAEKLDDNITITLKDNDLNVIPGAGNDVLPAGLVFTVTAEGATNTTLTVGGIEAAGYTFEEVEPGVFQVTIPAKDLLDMLYRDPVDGLGKTVQLTYTDPVVTGSVQGAIVSQATTASFKVLSHTAEVTVTPEKVSPYGVITVKIYDPDLAGKTAGYITSNELLKASSNKADAAAFATAITPVYPAGSLPSENGTFIFQIPLNDTLVNPVDTVAIVYKDPVDANGGTSVTVKSVEVYTETGQLELPKEVAPGTTVEIVVKDFDANTKADEVEYVNVTIWSSALPIKTTVKLVETGEDTGVFSNVIRITDNPEEIGQPNTVYAPAGSTVYIQYVDKLAANGETDVPVEGSFKVVESAVVSRPAVPQPEKSELLDPATLQPVTTAKAGKQVLVVVPVENKASSDVTVYAVVTVYKEGVPVAFSFSVNVLKANSVTELPVTLPALEPGTYTVKIVLVDSLKDLNPVSEEPVELTITVE